jgi:type VI secretion system protein ImpG
MNDGLLQYYNSELKALRDLAEPFAKAHPKVAGRLRLAGDMAEDPFVGRLLQGVALMNARIAQRLDDDFPLLAESLLGQLAPFALAPMPSMAVLALEPPEDRPQLSHVAAGTLFDSEAVRDINCRFRTVYPVDLLPIRLHSAQLTSAPFTAPQHPMSRKAAACLRLTLKTATADMRFDELPLNRLRLFLGEDAHRGALLHELLLSCCLGVSLAETPNDPNPVLLPASAVEPVGFTAAEAALPDQPGDAGTPRLLLEFFAFPAKFLFLDLASLDHKIMRGCGDTLEIFLYLTRSDAALERTVSASDFALFATPIINLFEQRCEPLRLDLTRSEYRLVPDARREQSTEIYAITNALVQTRDGRTLPCPPLFGPTPIDTAQAPKAYQAHRRPSPFKTGGSDLFITIIDRDGAMDVADDDLLITHALCFNRDLPARLPFGAGHPHFSALDRSNVIGRARCLVAPSAALPPPAGAETLWPLVATLNLNHQSLAASSGTVPALSQLVALYNRLAASGSRTAPQRLQLVRAAPSVARTPVRGQVAFCTGVDITLEMDDQPLSGSDSFLFAMVLDRLLAGMAAINAFTRVSLVAAPTKTPCNGQHDAANEPSSDRAGPPAR